MKINFSIFILTSLLLSACEKTPGSSDCKSSVPAGATVEMEGDAPAPTTCADDSNTTPVEPVPETPVPTGPDPDPSPVVPTDAERFSANVSFTNFDDADEDKVYRALDLIKQVVRTQQFKTRVLNHKYNGVKSYASTNKSNAAIYQSFLDGAETLRPEKNHQMDLQLELYTNNSNNVVGYTYPNVLKIWMNTKYFNRYEPCEVARNLFHEWTHKLGYGHDSSATARRPYSVPYAVGTIVQDIACDL